MRQPPFFQLFLVQDDALCFTLPKKSCRENLLRLYYDKYIAPLVVEQSENRGKEEEDSFSITTIAAASSSSSQWWFRRGQKKRMSIDKAITQDFMVSFAEEIEGFSGREVRSRKGL